MTLLAFPSPRRSEGFSRPSPSASTFLSSSSPSIAPVYAALCPSLPQPTRLVALLLLFFVVLLLPTSSPRLPNSIISSERHLLCGSDYSDMDFLIEAESVAASGLGGDSRHRTHVLLPRAARAMAPSSTISTTRSNNKNNDDDGGAATRTALARGLTCRLRAFVSVFHSSSSTVPFGVAAAGDTAVGELACGGVLPIDSLFVVDPVWSLTPFRDRLYRLSGAARLRITRSSSSAAAYAPSPADSSNNNNNNSAAAAAASVSQTSIRDVLRSELGVDPRYAIVFRLSSLFNSQTDSNPDGAGGDSTGACVVRLSPLRGALASTAATTVRLVALAAEDAPFLPTTADENSSSSMSNSVGAAESSSLANDSRSSSETNGDGEGGGNARAGRAATRAVSSVGVCGSDAVATLTITNTGEVLRLPLPRPPAGASTADLPAAASAAAVAVRTVTWGVRGAKGATAETAGNTNVNNGDDDALAVLSLPPGCGLRFALVTDRAGSIQPWYVWIPTTVYTAVVVVVVLPAAVLLRRRLPVGVVALLVAMVFLGLLGCCIGLMVELLLWQSAVGRMFPFPPAVTLYTCLCVLYVLLFLPLVWRRGHHVILWVGVSRLSVYAINVAACVGFWIAGYVVLGSLALLQYVLTNAAFTVYFAVITVRLSRMKNPDKYLRSTAGGGGDMGGGGALLVSPTAPPPPLPREGESGVGGGGGGRLRFSDAFALLWFAPLTPFAPCVLLYQNLLSVTDGAAAADKTARGARLRDAVYLYNTQLCLLFALLQSVWGVALLAAAAAFHMPFVVALLMAVLAGLLHTTQAVTLYVGEWTRWRRVSPRLGRPWGWISLSAVLDYLTDTLPPPSASSASHQRGYREDFEDTNSYIEACLRRAGASLPQPHRRALAGPEPRTAATAFTTSSGSSSAFTGASSSPLTSQTAGSGTDSGGGSDGDDGDGTRRGGRRHRSRERDRRSGRSQQHHDQRRRHQRQRLLQGGSVARSLRPPPPMTPGSEMRHRGGGGGGGGGAASAQQYYYDPQQQQQQQLSPSPDRRGYYSYEAEVARAHEAAVRAGVVTPGMTGVSPTGAPLYFPPPPPPPSTFSAASLSPNRVPGGGGGGGGAGGGGAGAEREQLQTPQGVSPRGRSRGSRDRSRRDSQRRYSRHRSQQRSGSRSSHRSRRSRRHNDNDTDDSDSSSSYSGSSSSGRSGANAPERGASGRSSPVEYWPDHVTR